MSPQDVVVREKSFIIQSGSYNTLPSLLHEISELFKKKSIPFYIDEVKGGRVKIRKYKTFNIKKGYKVELRLSKFLASILGYTSSPIDDQTLRFDEESEYIAPHNPNLFLIYPKNLIVGSNIVDDTIFAGHHVKLLQ